VAIVSPEMLNAQWAMPNAHLLVIEHYAFGIVPL
jgi:hypothetical protein